MHCNVNNYIYQQQWVPSTKFTLWKHPVPIPIAHWIFVFAINDESLSEKPEVKETSLDKYVNCDEQEA